MERGEEEIEGETLRMYLFSSICPGWNECEGSSNVDVRRRRLCNEHRNEVENDRDLEKEERRDTAALELTSETKKAML